MRIAVSMLLLAALAAGALLAGCGDDSEGAATGSNGAGTASGSAEAANGSTSESPEPLAASQLSKQQYVKQANAICTRSREQRFEELDAYREENPIEGENGQDEYLTGVLPEIYAPSISAMLSELRELGAPKGDEKQVEAIIVAFEDWVDTAERLEGDEPPSDFFNEVNRASTLAGNYGMSECTSG